MTCMYCQRFRIKSSSFREALSEFLGTFTLVLLGLSCNAEFTLSGGTGMGSPAVLCLGWGLSVASGIYIAGGASGGHINPAVTTSLALCKLFPWKKVPLYLLAQYLGAFTACPFVYIVYLDSMNNIDGGVRETTGINATAGIFATYPAPHVTILGGFADQAVAVGMFIMLIVAITDDKNMKPHRGFIPLAIGFIFIMIVCAFGMNCGCPMNPARDFSPRVFTVVAGWGIEPFRDYRWYWVPIVAPHIGGAIGGLVYVGFIRYHWAFLPETSENKVGNHEVTKRIESTELQLLIKDQD